MRGLVDEGRPDFKLDKAGGYDSPNTALCLVRGGTSHVVLVSRGKHLLPRYPFPRKAHGPVGEPI